MPRPRAASVHPRGRRAHLLAAAASGALLLSGCALLPWSVPDSPSTAPSSTAAARTPWPTITPVPSPTNAREAEWVRPGEIPVGACVQAAHGVRYTTYQVAPCDELHDGQVVAQGIIGGTRLPSADDQERWDALFEEQCKPAFREFTGTEWDSSRLSMITAAVESQAEFEAGHRALTCLIVMYDQTPFAGSARGRSSEEQFERHAPGWRAPTDAELYSDEDAEHRA